MPARNDSLGLKRVLCATDFSDSAAAALEVAVAFARRCGADIRIVHVQPAPVPPGRPMACRADRPDDKSPADLIQALHRCRQPAIAAGVACEGVLRQGDPSEEIVREAKHAAADLVVIGRHSQGASNPWILGSVAERVLRRAPCPLVVVTPFPRRGAGPRRILCGLDLGATAMATLEYAVTLSLAIDADLLVLHVVADGANLAGARRALAAGIAKLRVPRDRLQEQVVTGVPHEAILAAARERAASFVVVGSHGGGIVDRQFLGSATLHLLRESECPVLVVPAHISSTSEPDAPDATHASPDPPRGDPGQATPVVKEATGPQARRSR